MARAAGRAAALPTLGLAALGLTWGDPAQAELRICNETGELQSLALGFKGGTDWNSRGWYNIAAGECVTAVEGELTQRYYYYFADSRTGGFQGQQYIFCIANNSFEIVGDTDCANRGFIEESFREIDTGETAVAFTLTLKAAKGTATGTRVKVPGGGSGGGDLGTQLVTEAPPVVDLGVDVAALISDLPEGRHGDPFTVSALFQGCELEAGRAYCGFHAQGVKLRVYFGGPTPPELMYALEELVLNAAVQVQGDMVEDRGKERAVVVRAVRPDPNGDKFRNLRAALQGDWQSETDRRLNFTVRGSEAYMRDRTEFQTAMFLELADTCPGYSGPGPVVMQTERRGAGAVTCFRVAEAGRRLVLEPVRGGPALVYRRPG